MMILFMSVFLNYSPDRLSTIGYLWFNCFGQILAGLGMWFVFWLKDYWYYYDEEGAMRMTTFNLFGDDMPVEIEFSGDMGHHADDGHGHSHDDDATGDEF